MSYAALYVDGEVQGGLDLDTYPECRVQIELGDKENGCRNCGEAIDTDRAGRWIHQDTGRALCDPEADHTCEACEGKVYFGDATRTWKHVREEPASVDCVYQEEAGGIPEWLVTGDLNMAEPATGPGSWCNSAAISVSDQENTVHVSISVGDPRGAFVMTIRKLDDGRLVMHTPYQGMGFAHMPLRKLNPGTYEINRAEHERGEGVS